MPHRQNPILTEKARNLRVRQFRRQYPVQRFIVDFACSEKKLVVEVDGGYHEYTENNDASRQNMIEAAG